MAQQDYGVLGPIGAPLAALGGGLESLFKGINVVSGNDPQTELNKFIGYEQANIAKLNEVDPAQATIRQNKLEALIEKTSKMPIYADAVGKALVYAKKEGKDKYDKFIDATKAAVKGTASPDQIDLVSKYTGIVAEENSDFSKVLSENFDPSKLDNKTRKNFYKAAAKSTFEKILSSQGEDSPKNMIEVAYRAVGGDKKAMAVLDLLKKRGKGGGGGGSGSGGGEMSVDPETGEITFDLTFSEALRVEQLKQASDKSIFSDIPFNASDDEIEGYILEKNPSMSEENLGRSVAAFKSQRKKLGDRIVNTIENAASKNGSPISSVKGIIDSVKNASGEEYGRVKKQYEPGSKSALQSTLESSDIDTSQPFVKGKRGGQKVRYKTTQIKQTPQQTIQQAKKYNTPDDVKADLQSGKITEKQAIGILQKDFGME